ncbi:MAG TPA: DNA helicase RecG, partial [Calditrichaeota bacterium]|nr:DNA helicase RecG [Calditrichota bacterium]
MYTLKKKDKVSAFGKVKPYFMQKALFVEEYEIINDAPQIHTGRIVPFYPEKKGISSKVLREKIYFVFSQKPEIEEFLPEEIIKYN